MPINRPAKLVGKDKIVRLTELLVPSPHSLYRREDDAVLVERHLTPAGIRLHVVELIVVDTFVYDNAIALGVLPSKRENLTWPWPPISMPRSDHARICSRVASFSTLLLTSLSFYASLCPTIALTTKTVARKLY